jgi:hypothetical protein
MLREIQPDWMMTREHIKFLSRTIFDRLSQNRSPGSGQINYPGTPTQRLSRNGCLVVVYGLSRLAHVNCSVRDRGAASQRPGVSLSPKINPENLFEGQGI